MNSTSKTIGDFAKVVSGFAFKSRDFVDSGIPVVKIANIQHEHVIFDSAQYLPTEFMNISERFHVREGDVMISLTGSHLSQPNSVVGRVARYRHKFTALLNQRAARIQVVAPEKLDQAFLYYFLRQPNVTRELTANAGGAANQANISPRDVERIELPPIDVRKQQSIADILSAYDDLIENNRRRIKLLEAAARQLYCEWFMRLRFPGHEHTKIVDGVPEGWCPGTVGDLGTIITGKTPSTKEADNFGNEVPFIKTPDMHEQSIILYADEMLSEKGAQSQVGKFLPEGAILVACIGAGIGAVSMTGIAAQTNQQINSVVPRQKDLLYYAYFALRDLKPRLAAIGGGATMPNVNKSKFSNLPIAIPKGQILREFHSSSAPMFEQMKTLHRQNHQLGGARDLLLPRLMDGRIAA